MKNAIATPKRPAVKKNATPKVSESDQKPATESASKREFTRTQLIVIGEVADLLHNGGTDDAMELLIAASAENYAHRIWDPLIHRRGDLEREVGEYRERLEHDWKLDLEIAIRANRKAPEPERHTPEDVSSQIRENVRDRVIELFDDFLSQGSPEEFWIFKDVMEGWDGFHRTPANNDHCVPLALGFQLALGKQQGMVKVPIGLIDKVEKYIDTLVAIEGRDL